ncbi:josephin-like protein [Brassica rapa]|uniref:josephin-like protein n=1 Tax=Brassica campestris TaxID=3711 RepID=UPI00142E1374|nr:josephin-like protein [Brassica rapa]
MEGSESQIYHERQRLQFCLLHSLNNLFQDKNAFTRESLNSIAEKLVADDPNKETWTTPLSFLLKPHHNTLTGNYDVNVMIAALEGKGKSVAWHDKRHGASSIDLGADNLMGVVLNVPVKRYGGLWRSRHWVVMRKINGVWYNLDSDLVVPRPFKEEDEVRGFLDQSLSLGSEVLLVNNAIPYSQLYSRKLLLLSRNMSATGTKRCNANTKPVTSGKQSSAKGPYYKNPGRTTSCGLRLPRKTEVTAAKLIKHLSCKFVKGVRLVVMRKNKKKRSPPLKASSTGRSQPSVISVANDTCRSEAIEDCIQFINSSTSFTRSSSASCRTS